MAARTAERRDAGGNQSTVIMLNPIHLLGANSERKLELLINPISKVAIADWS